MKVVREQVW